MCSTTLVVAVASLMVSHALESPLWHADYGIAQFLGREESKPLAVFIGSGKAGWSQVSREGILGKEVKQLLATNYICLYIDTDLEAGKQLAFEFELPEGPGLVISDYAGSYQAFRHPGDLPGEQLARYLNRYADPGRILRTTETNSSGSASYSPLDNSVGAIQPYYRPQGSSPVFSGGGRSC